VQKKYCGSECCLCGLWDKIGTQEKEGEILQEVIDRTVFEDFCPADLFGMHE
jgi:hypothetical protein